MQTTAFNTKLQKLLTVTKPVVAKPRGAAKRPKTPSVAGVRFA